MHFQRALAADLGYCSLDPKRRPLSGREQRGCWEGRQTATPTPRPVPLMPLHRLRAGPARLETAEPVELPTRAHREFVPIDTMSTTQATAEGANSESPLPGIQPVPDVDWADRTSLFGDASG